MSKLSLPAGLSEAEEAKWWYDHREELFDEFLDSPESEHPVRGATARQLGIVASIVIPLEDAQLARKQAQQQGLDFRQYTAQVLHEALLERELRKSEREPRKTEHELRKAS